MHQVIRSPSALGQVIREYRKQKRLNQSDAGKQFNIGQPTFSKVEQGIPGMQIDTIFRVLAALDLEMVIQPRNSEDTQDW